MKISKREFLKRLGIGGAALVGAPLAADAPAKTRSGLPPGSIGDPDNVWFGRNIFPLNHTIEDVPSWLKLKMWAPKKKACVICSTATSVPSGAATSTEASALRYFSMSASIFASASGVQIFQYASLITEQSGVKSASAAPTVAQTAQNTIPDFLMSSFLSVLFFRELTQSCYSNIADILSNPIPSVNVTANRPRYSKNAGLRLQFVSPPPGILKH